MMTFILLQEHIHSTCNQHKVWNNTRQFSWIDWELSSSVPQNLVMQGRTMNAWLVKPVRCSQLVCTAMDTECNIWLNTEYLVLNIEFKWVSGFQFLMTEINDSSWPSVSHSPWLKTDAQPSLFSFFTPLWAPLWHHQIQWHHETARKESNSRIYLIFQDATLSCCLSHDVMW